MTCLKRLVCLSLGMLTVISQVRNVLRLICQLFTKGVVSQRKQLKNESSLNNVSICFKQFGILNVKDLFIFYILVVLWAYTVVPFVHSID